MTAPFLPDWPRLMRRRMAAAYVDMSEAAFEREVAAGRFPIGRTIGGREHWCRKELDRALDRLTGQDNDSPLSLEERLTQYYG